MASSLTFRVFIFMVVCLAYTTTAEEGSIMSTCDIFRTTTAKQATCTGCPMDNNGCTATLTGSGSLDSLSCSCICSDGKKVSCITRLATQEDIEKVKQQDPEQYYDYEYDYEYEYDESNGEDSDRDQPPLSYDGLAPVCLSDSYCMKCPGYCTPLQTVFVGPPQGPCTCTGYDTQLGNCAGFECKVSSIK